MMDDSDMARVVLMPRTRRKLAEAQFYLGCMEQQAQSPLNPPLERLWEVFGYYWSAPAFIAPERRFRKGDLANDRGVGPRPPFCA